MRRNSTAPAPDASHQGVWNFETSGESETDRCVALWAAVVQQAFTDALGHHAVTEAERDQAREFLTATYGMWKAQRAYVCSLLGVDPDDLRRTAIARGVQPLLTKLPLDERPVRQTPASAEQLAREARKTRKRQRLRRKQTSQKICKNWRKANKNHPAVVALRKAEYALEKAKKSGAREPGIAALKEALRAARKDFTAAYRAAVPSDDPRRQARLITESFSSPTDSLSCSRNQERVQRLSTMQHLVLKIKETHASRSTMESKLRVYLTGPITGNRPKTIRSWRDECAELMSSFASVVDPASHSYDSTVAYRKKETAGEELQRLKHGRLVIERNKRLIRDSDVLLANLLEARQRVSIGSVCEISWAAAYDKFIVIVRDEQQNIHDHAMLNAMASAICPTLEEAVKVIEQVSNANPRTAQSA